MSIVNRRLTMLTMGMAVACSTQARASYIISIEDDNGLHSSPLTPGATYPLNVVLTGTSVTTTAIFTLTVSEPGLVLTDIFWGFPYITDGDDDLSVPQFPDLPVVLTADTFAETTAVDAMFSNFTPNDAFGVGTLLSFDLMVPVDIPTSTVIEVGIGVFPSFNEGFGLANITDIQSFYIGVPEPASLALFVLVGVAAWRQRRGGKLV